MSNRYKDWLLQAKEEFRWAKSAQEDGNFSLVCFLCQQVAEKSLKAICYYRGADLVKSHSVTEISKFLNLTSEIEEAGKKLDQYYISTRYPDAFTTGAPYIYFTTDQGISALVLAQLVLDCASNEVAHESA